MAQCAHCNSRLRDGFVFVTPVDESTVTYSTSDAHRKSAVFQLATESGGELSSICGKCAGDLVAYVDDLISETEAYNTSYIKFLTDINIGLPISNSTMVLHYFTLLFCH
jgi:hypothetical protein